MKIDTIKNHLKGYFINRIEHTDGRVSETLCRKINNAEYETLEAVKTPSGNVTASVNLLNQINNQILNPSICICSLEEILPVINGRIFDLYEARERKIDKYIKWCSCVESDDNEFVNGKYIVKWKKPRGFGFGIVDGDKLTEIDGDIFDDQQRKSAVFIKYPKLLRTALKDDLINQYEDEYLHEVRRYHEI